MNIFVTLALIVGGLLICWLSSVVKFRVLAAVFFWTGLVVAVIGLLILIVPALAWLRNQLLQIMA